MSSLRDASAKEEEARLAKKELEVAVLQRESAHKLAQDLRAQLEQEPTLGPQDESSLKHQLEIEREAKEEALKSLEKLKVDSLEVERLRERLQAEEEENAQLSKSLKEQQGVIKAALTRIYPEQGSMEECCPEHLEAFERFVAMMKKEKVRNE